MTFSLPNEMRTFMVKQNKTKNNSYSQFPKEIEHLESDRQFIPNNMNLQQDNI